LGYKWLAYKEEPTTSFVLKTGTLVKECIAIYPFNLVLYATVPDSYCNSCGLRLDSDTNTFCVVPQDYYKQDSEVLKHCNMLTCLFCYYRAVFESQLKGKQVPYIVKRRMWWSKGRLIEIDSRKHNDIDRHVGSGCCHSVQDKADSIYRQFSKYTGNQNELVQLIVSQYLYEVRKQNKDSTDDALESPLPVYGSDGKPIKTTVEK